MSTIFPALSVLFAVLATAVPWGLPADATFILPLIVVTMVFCWRIIPDAVLPLSVCMLLGLLTDVMSGGPLGFFALMTLIAGSVGGRLRSLIAPHELRNLVARVGRARGKPRAVRLAARLALFLPLDRLVADPVRDSRLDRAVSRGAARTWLDQAGQYRAGP